MGTKPTSIMKTTMGAQLKTKRLKANLSQSRVATLMNVGKSTYSDWERNLRPIPSGWWNTFCEVIDRTMKTLPLPDRGAIFVREDTGEHVGVIDVVHIVDAENPTTSTPRTTHVLFRYANNGDTSNAPIAEWHELFVTSKLP